ncbi:U3 snoRNP protein [Homalodisca vitripennis]|nr:U3 snoRNP protein [Homalodisca vitripennis]
MLISVLVVIAQQFISHNAPAVPGGSGSCVATSRRPVHSIGRRQLHSLVVPCISRNNKSSTLPVESSYNFTCLDLSPNGYNLIAINEQGDAYLISLLSRSVVHRYKFNHAVTCVKFSIDGSRFAVCKQNNVFIFKAPGQFGGKFNQFVMERVYHNAFDDTTCVDWASDSRLVYPAESLSGQGLGPVVAGYEGLDSWNLFMSVSRDPNNVSDEDVQNELFTSETSRLQEVCLIYLAAIRCNLDEEVFSFVRCPIVLLVLTRMQCYHPNQLF